MSQCDGCGNDDGIYVVENGEEKEVLCDSCNIKRKMKRINEAIRTAVVQNLSKRTYPSLIKNKTLTRTIINSLRDKIGDFKTVAKTYVLVERVIIDTTESEFDDSIPTSRRIYNIKRLKKHVGDT